MLDWLRLDAVLWWWHTASSRHRAAALAAAVGVILLPVLWWQSSTPRVVPIPDDRWQGSSELATAPSQAAMEPVESIAMPDARSRASSCAPAGPVDLNTATAEQLDTLPGIGPVIAGRIVQWRERNGRFTSVDELREVEGIGPVTWSKLAPLVDV